MSTKEIYFNFVEERHRIWERRQAGLPREEWTTDPVLADRKFCNVYRVLDAGSQFVVKELLSGVEDAEEALFLSLLYRYTNRPEPFVHFAKETGRYPTLVDLEDGTLSAVWTHYHEGGNPIFGSAYTIFCGQENAGMTRLEWVLWLMSSALLPWGSHFIFADFIDAEPGLPRLEVLKRPPRVADFMGQQVLTDFNYWGGDSESENEYVVPGPGSARGIQRIDPSVKPRAMADFIRALRVEVLARPSAPSLEGRPPSLMDIQNTLCEFDKYMRHRGNEVRATKYEPAHPGPQPAPTLPQIWAVDFADSLI